MISELADSGWGGGKQSSSPPAQEAAVSGWGGGKQSQPTQVESVFDAYTGIIQLWQAKLGIIHF